MTAVDVPIPLLLVGPALAGGLLWLGMRHRDLRREYRRLDASACRLHRERQERDEALADLQLEVGGIRHVIHDGGRRWGAGVLVDFPLVRALIGQYDGEEATRWLLAHAPGDWSYLGDGGEPTDRLAIRPFDGWRPPKQNGNGRRRRVQATGARGD